MVDGTLHRLGSVQFGRALLWLALLASCRASDPREEVIAAGVRTVAMVRSEMVARLEREIADPRVLSAFRRVPREEFVPAEHRAAAYEDRALPLGGGQNLTDPRLMARMLELAAVEPQARVLEVGSGSGYQAALLSAMGAEVYSVELLPSLVERARENLARAGAESVNLKVGDGAEGWPEAAPFAAIVVCAAVEEVPEALLEQLAEGGRLVVPLGDRPQMLTLVTRTADGYAMEPIVEVLFAPLGGPAGRAALHLE